MSHDQPSSGVRDVWNRVCSRLISAEGGGQGEEGVAHTGLNIIFQE